jgi:transcriptional regulator with XRE-family HTH domain
MADSVPEVAVIAARLREGRTALGLTQEDVAGVVGIPRSGVAEMEAGRRGVSGLELRRLARLYRRSVAWLVGEDDDIPVDPILAEQVARLTPQDRDQVLTFARFLSAQQTGGHRV